MSESYMGVEGLNEQEVERKAYNNARSNLLLRLARVWVAKNKKFKAEYDKLLPDFIEEQKHSIVKRERDRQEAWGRVDGR